MITGKQDAERRDLRSEAGRGREKKCKREKSSGNGESTFRAGCQPIPCACRFQRSTRWIAGSRRGPFDVPTSRGRRGGKGEREREGEREMNRVLREISYRISTDKRSMLSSPSVFNAHFERLSFGGHAASNKHQLQAEQLRHRNFLRV
jgi:hypothetical protein